MLPEIYEDILTADFEEQEIPSVTFALNTDRKTIEGFVDEQEAVKQAALLILNTERFNHIIYSHDYGLETMDLYDSDYPLIYTKIKENISEALLQDDRIEAVSGFEFEKGRNWISVTFLIETIYGNAELEKTFEGLEG